jgi:predicted MFS family arabinose efflux permease
MVRLRRWPDALVVGFLMLALAGVALAAGTTLSSTTYWSLLPGLLVFGTGLAVVLTVNDPVSLDMVPVQHHGQASGVSATAEQFGGALGIAIFYLVFHATYVDRFVSNVSKSSLADLSDAQVERFRRDIQDAEQTGLHPDTFDPALNAYLDAARDGSYFGYTVVFTLLSGLAIAAVIVMARLVRRPEPAPGGDDATGSP